MRPSLRILTKLEKVLSASEKVLFFACLLFLPTQLGKHFFTPSSYIFSLPIDYLSFTIYFWDILVGFLFFIFVRRNFLTNRFKKLNVLALNIFLFFILTQAVSLANPLNFTAGLFRLEQFFIIGLFGIYILSQDLKENKNLIVTSLSLGLFFEMGLAMFQAAFGKTLGLWILGERSFSVNTPGIARFDWFGQVFLRAYGTFPHPNVLGAYSLIVLAVIFGFTKKAYYLILPSAILVFLSFSRSAFLIFIIEMLVFFKDLLVTKYKIALAFILIITPLLLIRFLSAFNFDLISIIRRKELIEVGFRAFITDPLFGVGLNSFINFVSSSNLIAGEVRFLQPVHNIFLLSLAETGLLGLLGLFGLLGKPFYICFKKRKNKLASALFFCWVVIFILGSFDHYFLTLAQGQRMLFLVWGLSFAMASQKSSS